jgi:hypothetical protein
MTFYKHILWVPSFMVCLLKMMIQKLFSNVLKYTEFKATNGKPIIYKAVFAAFHSEVQVMCW